ncbi:enoyl-CoA hydratase-related protein [Thaumasiovibrio subtropicus]|uniref:enoyl-CoA hydratase-related protein n=1 Tax=Thaumasiovibrio subtropicus TaxID=1891207 RepID=UPI00131D147D|nr:enoyl-CoA hydratase-related protein [Thaumasiovibrio subtropicus]
MRPIKLSTVNDVTHIELNRPDLHHRLDDEMLIALINVFREPECRVFVISAFGPVFCAGADLRWMLDTENQDSANLLSSLLEVMDHCPVPIVVAVDGDVFGGGLGLLACADIVFAQPETHFCFSETRLGLVPATIAPYVLRAAGIRQAQPLMIKGDKFTAFHAAQIGIVHQLSSMPLADAFLWAHQTTAAAPNAIREVKQLCRQLDPITEQARELAIATLNRVRKSEEAQQGIDAFLNKLPPPWHDDDER